VKGGEESMSDQSIPLALPSELQSAWRDWQKAFLPVENLRVGRVNAPTYEVEFDLDHQAGYLGALFEAFAAHNPHWDFALRAGGELRDLQTIRAELESSGAGATEVQALRTYMDLTERLIRAILTADAQRQPARR
jgi:hypothetical protein